VHSISRAAAAFALLAAVVLLTTVHGRASGTQISFTAAQVSAGYKTFEQVCSTCHGTNLEGGAGPALTGPNWKTLSVKIKAKVTDVFTLITTEMPLNAPATLSHTEYVNIMAFILSKNGYKPGATPLTFAAASSSQAAILKE